MCKWLNEYQDIGQSAFPGKGKLQPEAEEIRQLRQQVKRLEICFILTTRCSGIYSREDVSGKNSCKNSVQD
jgi:transposase